MEGGGALWPLSLGGLHGIRNTKDTETFYFEVQH